MPRARVAELPQSVVQALSAAAGAALVLDGTLRIELATPEASSLLGYEIPLGSSAPKLLCGDGPKRPIAEALAEGRPVQAVLPQPGAGGSERLVRVRSVPLSVKRGTGWLLLLDEVLSYAPEPVLFHGMWTQAPNMKHVFRIIERVAPEEVTVLVRGDTGTGKELVARALHTLSRRSKGPFRALNCAALPANLLESELFGHARGAFTGAVKDMPGHVQLAHGGTLFLDEVAELPLELQAKLLRVLETQTVLPVGAREPLKVDVRIVSATHRALRREVELGRFRADLMYRLRVIPIFLPALRERREDVALLSEKMRLSLNQTSRRRVERIAPAALALLERYDFPGNVRELRNVLAYAFAMGEGPILQANDLPGELLDPRLGASQLSPATSLRAEDALDDESRKMLRVLERTGQNRTRAAKVLGISRVTLWRRLRELQRARPAAMLDAADAFEARE